MQDWSAGYITDIEYTFGYYAELNPLAVSFALLANGYEPPSFQNACELGFGQGLSINFHSATSHCSWWGTDFHPAQANYAGQMAGFSGTRIFNEAFAEFCSRKDLPDFDFIGLHGIWSWVNDENRNTIADFINRKLKTGGVVYLSYNALPGWASASPLKHLISEHYGLMTRSGDGPVRRVDASLAFIDQLFALDPLLLQQTPSIAEAFKRLRSQERDYLLHEYLNETWRSWYFSEVAAQMKALKLSFAAGAKTTDGLDQLNFTSEQIDFMKGIADPVFRETISDYIACRHFRRDYWVKGARKLNPTEKHDALRAINVVLTFPVDRIPRSIPIRNGEAKLASEVYDPLLSLLDDHKPRSLETIEAFMAQKGISFERMLDALLLLNGKGYLTAAHDDAGAEKLKNKTSSLNRHLMLQAKGGEQAPFLVSPVTGGGFPAWRFEKLICLAILDGRDVSQDIARYIWALISPYGQKLVKDGQVIEGVDDNLKELERLAESFIKERLVAFRALKIL